MPSRSIRQNPFVYGEAVIGDNFCDRKDEIVKLKIDIGDCQKIFFISPRKFGKTSLIKTVMNELNEENFITVFVDIEGLSSYKEFLDVYLFNLLSEYSPVEKILYYLKEILPGIRVNFSIDESNKPILSLGYSPNDPAVSKIATKIYCLPEILQKKRKKKILVVFDEFQEILKLNGQNIEASLRASVQHQRNVSYIFAGSKRRLLADMVLLPDKPFYKIGPVMYLKKIPEYIFMKFTKNKFNRTKIEVSDEVINKIMGISENIPYYVQMFCHELWDIGFVRKKISLDDVDTMLKNCIENHSQDFHLIWSRLIMSKRQLLKAISISGGKNILSKKFIESYNLGLPSSIRQTLVSLLEESYIDRENGEYYFTDLLFREWIKRYIPQPG